MLNYNHNQIEKKWQDYWDENKTFKTNDNLGQKKFYKDMFPYPSGAGYMLDILRAIQQQISFQDIRECKDIMCYIRWGGMHSDYQQSNML